MSDTFHACSPTCIVCMAVRGFGSWTGAPDADLIILDDFDPRGCQVIEATATGDHRAGTGDGRMTPSEAIRQGKCPSCLGTGRVHRFVPVEDIYPCSTCGGSGTWPPPD